MNYWFSIWLLVALELFLAPVLQGAGNLLLNGEFKFSSFDSSRYGAAQTYRSGSIPFWDQEAYGSVEVFRSTRNPAFRPRFPVEGVVVLHPGKSISQFALLDELKLDAGEVISLSVLGFQTQGRGLRASISVMKLDSMQGEWSPATFGQSDTRRFPKRARGELIPVEVGHGESGVENHFELKLENISIAVPHASGNEAASANIIGVRVEFTNLSGVDVWIYSPTLVRGALAANRLESIRSLPEIYKHLPRTITKLRRGQPLHIVSMGSSIDRASANPPLYLYDEDATSPRFKEPISAGLLFDGEKVGHPEWTPYFGSWAHYLGYTGRLRRSLMRRYDYPIDKILLNVMACDGSSIGESHSALAEWSSLAHPPDPELNGHKSGRTWKDLYPSVIKRPEGASPDLVLFGSGANEKVDGPDEVAAFEGAVRWFQRHYPGVEFIFCMWQNREEYTANAGMLKDLALHYGIPIIDVGRELSLLTRHGDITALVPEDGHPQAAAHAIWSYMLEKAFQCVDPIAPGIPQRYLPERLSPYTIGWEGEVATYPASSPRIRLGTAFILDETTVNLWASGGKDRVDVRIDGVAGNAPEYQNQSRLKPLAQRDPRNSVYTIGRLALGDQHLIEVTGGAKIVAVDSKRPLNRIWHGIQSKAWRTGEGHPVVEAFTSAWGAPYGTAKLTLNAGESATLRWVGTDCSIAWLAQPGGGTLLALIDGEERFRQPTAEYVQLADGTRLHMENRKGIRGFPYGVHELVVRADRAPVALLGAFTYDTRPNRSTERIEAGFATPGDTIAFTPPFTATPLIHCSGGLKIESASTEKVTFMGEEGSYQAIGE